MITAPIAQGDDAQGHVGQEQPPPTPEGDDDSSHQRSDGRREQAGPHDIGHQSHDVGLVRIGQHDDSSHRHHERRPHPLQRARHHEFTEIVAQRRTASTPR